MNNAYPPQYAYPSAPPVYRVLPNPPRLHWGWVLVLNAITRGLFGAVWLLVQSSWVRKVNGRSTAFVWAIVHVAFFPFIFVAAFVAGMMATVAHVPIENVTLPIMTVSVVGVLVLYLTTTYLLRSELQQTPIGIPLGGAMTFFFGTIYFQYHLRDFQFYGANDGYSLGLQGGVVPLTTAETVQPPYPGAQG